MRNLTDHIQWKKKCCQNETFGDLVTTSLKLFNNIKALKYPKPRLQFPRGSVLVVAIPGREVVI